MARLEKSEAIWQQLQEVRRDLTQAYTSEERERLVPRAEALRQQLMKVRRESNRA